MGTSNGTSGVPMGTTNRGAVRPDHQNIHFTSKKEIGMSIQPHFASTIQKVEAGFKNLFRYFLESRYCKKHQTMRKQSSFDNSNNSNLNSEDSSFGFFHQGYGVMPKYPGRLEIIFHQFSKLW